MMLFVQEMVWNIMHNVDLETAKATTLEKRVSRKLQEFPFFQVSIQISIIHCFLLQVPFLELSGLIEDQFVYLSINGSSRFVESHLFL